MKKILLLIMMLTASFCVFAGSSCDNANSNGASISISEPESGGEQGEDPQGEQGEDPQGGQGEDPQGGQGEDPQGGQGEDPQGGQGEDPQGGQGEEENSHYVIVNPITDGGSFDMGNYN